MADALLDTSFFIDLHRRDLGAWQFWNRVIAGEIMASFSAITSLELWMGNFADDEEAFYTSALLVMDECVLDSAAARLAAAWLKAITPLPERLIRDALIAASAHQSGATVYTRNLRDFARFPGVSVEPY